MKFTRWLLIATTIVFAFWRFSEPTADPDLWGHVLYGQRTLSGMEIEYTEPFSWTAQGHDWINHEMIAEIIMGVVHKLAGSTGLWALMLTLSFSSLLYAIRIGKKDAHYTTITWVIGLLMCREAAIGFSMRPQLFSAVYFVVFLGCIRPLFKGARWPVIALPILLCAWINTHGAALLALILLLVAIGSQAIAPFVTRLAPAPLKPYLTFEPVSSNVWRILLLTTIGSWLAVGITPYGFDLLNWLIESVRYVRPEITEWNPTPLTSEHLLFFISFPLFALLACINRKAKRPWEIGILTVLFIAAVRHERHIALYSLAYIAIAPHTFDTFLQSEAIKSWARKHITITRAKVVTLNLFLLFSTLGFAWQGFIKPSGNRFQMQVPREEYPVAAMEFLNNNNLSGNLIVYFNWAQMALWEMSNSPVSFDGRLDTCYPRDIIEAHWKLYFEGTLPETVFDFSQTELILIPHDLAIEPILETLPSWRLIYQDRLANVYLNTNHNNEWTRPLIQQGAEATTGSVSFPNKLSPRAELTQTSKPTL